MPFDLNSFIPSVEGNTVFDMIQGLTLQPFLLYPIILFFVVWFLVRLFFGLSRTKVKKGKRIRRKFFISTGLWWGETILQFILLGLVVVLTLFLPYYVKLLN